MNWKVGDIAVVRNTVAPYWAQYVGTECTIVAVGIYSPMGVYMVRLTDGTEVGANEHHLRRHNDPDNARDTCEWADIEDDCGWRPKEPVTIDVNPEVPA